jgi:EPS-associated MarR family transcriptional regulator
VTDTHNACGFLHAAPLLTLYPLACVATFCSTIERHVLMQPEEVRHQLLRLIEQRPSITQREAAQALCISLGKVNYCLNALIDKGYVKLDNFRRQENKRVYVYLLTPSGLEEKARITVQFLRRKLAEYERLKQEIDDLIDEVGLPAVSAEPEG